MNFVIYLVAILIAIICWLGYKLSIKRKIENNNLQEFLNKKIQAEQEYHTIQAKIDTAENSLSSLESKYQILLDKYSSENAKIDDYFNELRAKQEQQLETAQKDKELAAQLKFEKLLAQYEAEAASAQEETQVIVAECLATQEQIKQDTAMQAERYSCILKPLMEYEKEKQDKLFYTIQVPEEYRDDIDFLLNTVSQKVQHPDIISKLIWTEYIKPYMDETIKRAGIEDKPGIYKITNLENGKSYIGKSTNVKKRLQDHFKSSVGIKTIADQAVHHEILKTGIWNWSLEIIIYCDKEQLNDMEKYYIDFFKSNTFGYNRTNGGEG